MTARKVKNPSDIFYWADYQNDEELERCSLAAQGLWMRCLCLAAKAIPKGYIKINDQPCTVADLAKKVGEAETVVASLIDELRRNRVCSWTKTGILYNRRMVKAAKISEVRSEMGKLGAAVKHGHPYVKSVLPSKHRGKRAGKILPSSILQESPPDPPHHPDEAELRAWALRITPDTPSARKFGTTLLRRDLLAMLERSMITPDVAARFGVARLSGGES